jgi:Zn-dependent oligopeptidase
MLRLLATLLILLLAGCATQQGVVRPAAAVAPISFPSTPFELESRCSTALSDSANRYDRIAAGESTQPLLAYEEGVALLGEATDHLTPLAKLHPDPAMRRAAADCKERVSNATTATLLRDDLYRRLAAAPADGTDQQRLKDLLLTEFRDNGLGVSRDEKDAFRQRAERLATLEREFSAALIDDPATIAFTPAELAGVPSALIARLERGDDGRLIVASSGDASIILRSATVESTRNNVQRFLDNRGPGNLERLAEIARLRHRQAQAMGRESWLAVRAASQMAGSPERVNGFLGDLQSQLAPLVTAELAAFARLKGDGSIVQPWDIPFLRSRLAETEAGIDEESLRWYFPLSQVRQGLFALAGRLFGLTFERVGNPAAWAPEVELYQVSEDDGAPVGWLYLDLLHRPGKADSAYELCLRTSRTTADGRLLPVTLLTASLRPAADGELQLLPRQVKTLLHEFGHTLHDLLGRAPYASLGTALIPWDSIEIPSTLFEQLAYEPAVLALLSGNSLPRQQAEAIRRSQRIAAASRYAATLLTARFDAALHGTNPPADPLLPWQQLHLEVMQLPLPVDSRTPGTLSHLVTGYDGRYYGYLWSAVIAANLLERLQGDSLLTRAAGKRLRDELLAPANRQPPDALIRAYLEREATAAPFRRSLLQ